MPKQPINYQKSIIYKIVCKDLNINDCYIGSTTNFIKRRCQHKSSCKNKNDNAYNRKVYKFIRENGDWQNWDMIPIEDYKCDNKLQLLKQERMYIEQLKPTLNNEIPTRTLKEYQKSYYEENKEKILNDCKKKYINQEIVNCNICKKKYKKKFFKRHMINQHKPDYTDMSKFDNYKNCEICDKLIYKCNLLRHIKLKH